MEHAKLRIDFDFKEDIRIGDIEDLDEDSVFFDVSGKSTVIVYGDSGDMMNGEVLPIILNEDSGNVAAKVILGCAMEIVYNLLEIVYVMSALDKNALILVGMDDISDIVHAVEIAIDVDAEDSIDSSHGDSFLEGIVPSQGF